MQPMGTTRPADTSLHSYQPCASTSTRRTRSDETPYVEMTSPAESTRPTTQVDSLPHSPPHMAARKEENKEKDNTYRVRQGAEGDAETSQITTAATAITNDNTEADVLLAENENRFCRCCACWRSLRIVWRELRPMHWLRYLWIFALMLMVFAGSTMQVVMLNFWLASYPADGSPGNYTTFAVSAIIFAAFFLVALAVYIAICRPSLRFLRKAQGWRWLLFVGAMDTLNSGLAIYAASYTSEVLQALFIAMVPVYAACLTKWVLKDPRCYTDGRVLTSFALIIAGVMLAASWVLFGLPHNKDTSDSSSTSSSSVSSAYSQRTCSSSSTSVHALPTHTTRWRGAMTMLSAEDAVSHRRWWAVVFFLSVPPMVLMNVGQTLYMLRFTYDESFADYVHSARRRPQGTTNNVHDTLNEEEEEDETAQLAAVHGLIAREGADDTTVKLVMLAMDTTTQALMALLLLPIDALPWFGRSPSVSAAWDNFRAGMDCLVHCPDNLMYCLLYSLGFVFVYIGAAYLNQYSVTLCSMVSLLASPATALLLVAFPQLNVTEEAAPWQVNAMACVLLAAGTTLYVRWESRTEHIKSEGERRLKLALLGLAPAPVVNYSGPTTITVTNTLVTEDATPVTNNTVLPVTLLRRAGEEVPYMPVQSEPSRE